MIYYDFSKNSAKINKKEKTKSPLKPLISGTGRLVSKVKGGDLPGFGWSSGSKSELSQKLREKKNGFFFLL
jgi:hypothetical protein